MTFKSCKLATSLRAAGAVMLSLAAGHLAPLARAAANATPAPATPAPATPAAATPVPASKVPKQGYLRFWNMMPRKDGAMKLVKVDALPSEPGLITVDPQNTY